MNNLENAFIGLFGRGEVTGCLASVLDRAANRGDISYDDVFEIAHDNSEDTLLLANEWRLLLPLRTVKSAAWEDRLLLCEPGELYEMPNIVRYAVEEAERTGKWNPGEAITRFFKEMGDPAWETIPILVRRLGENAMDYRISAAQIRKACAEFSLAQRLDMLIAELKGSGVMSPKLGSFAEVNREGSPLYELNPSLYINDKSN